jgi:hypothetical protein
MTAELRDVDIGNNPSLLKLAEEVRRSGEGRALTRNGERVAVLLPLEVVEEHKPRRKRTPEDIAAFRSSAGSWAHEDTDKLLEDIHESRRISTRPAPEL